MDVSIANVQVSHWKLSLNIRQIQDRSTVLNNVRQIKIILLAS